MLVMRTLLLNGIGFSGSSVLKAIKMLVAWDCETLLVVGSPSQALMGAPLCPVL
jgi:hypothetical protein